MGSPVNTQALLTATSIPNGCYDESFRLKRTHSKVAFSDVCDGDTSTRPQTAATVDSNSGQESGGVVCDQVHSRIEIDAAEVLLSLHADDKLLPVMKRTRRGSKY